MEKKKIFTVDCRSEEGITIGLIDSLISIARVLAKRDLNETVQIKEALKDLRSDEDISHIISNSNKV
ncbi:hypothetical protein [Chryseobacterium arthrosphaerae]|uniref:hypothetical protein n=1 Tax=Chryseobacterium arthrosphaerae TaxID=651561 RepID=UPI00241DC4AD|nr:hypothetical protein [Chryseobacterium arthrosphaerae]